MASASPEFLDFHSPYSVISDLPTDYEEYDTSYNPADFGESLLMFSTNESGDANGPIIPTVYDLEYKSTPYTFDHSSPSDNSNHSRGSSVSSVGYAPQASPNLNGHFEQLTFSPPPPDKLSASHAPSPPTLLIPESNESDSANGPAFQLIPATPLSPADVPISSFRANNPAFVAAAPSPSPPPQPQAHIPSSLDLNNSEHQWPGKLPWSADNFHYPNSGPVGTIPSPELNDTSRSGSPAQEPFLSFAPPRERRRSETDLSQSFALSDPKPLNSAPIEPPTVDMLLPRATLPTWDTRRRSSLAEDRLRAEAAANAMNMAEMYNNVNSGGMLNSAYAGAPQTPYTFPNPPQTAPLYSFNQTSNAPSEFLTLPTVSMRRNSLDGTSKPHRPSRSVDYNYQNQQYLSASPLMSSSDFPDMSSTVAGPSTNNGGRVPAQRHSRAGSTSSDRRSPYISPRHLDIGLPTDVEYPTFDDEPKTAPLPLSDSDLETKVVRQLVTTGRTAEASRGRRKQEANFQCPVPGCGSTFTRSFNLKGHLRSHNEEKPFKCKWPGCGKGFARQHDCKRHEQLHSNYRPFQCIGCQKPFARMDALNRHLRSDGGIDCMRIVEDQAHHRAIPIDDSTLYTVPKTDDHLEDPNNAWSGLLL